MRLVFCFSRSCRPYPTTVALRSLPCWPGAKLRFSTGHLSVKHLAPFKNSFMPSRRQRRQTGPVYLAIVLLYSSVDRFTGWCSLLPDPFLQGLRNASLLRPRASFARASAHCALHPHLTSDVFSNSPSLGRPASVMRDGGDVANRLH